MKRMSLRVIMCGALCALPALAQTAHQHHPPESAAEYARVLEDPERDGWQKPHEVILALKLTGQEKYRVGTYSKGMQQRIGLARAIYGEPALIVLDEPNSNLDEAGENALRTTIQQLKAQGKTVVLITHRLGVLNTTDKIMELRQGTVHWYGPREDFAQRAVASTQLSATAN